MNTFKVICKAPANRWEPYPRPMKIVTNSKFFGLIKSTTLEVDNTINHGPIRDEICIVTEVESLPDYTGYVIKGYPDMSYDSQWFIRLDEITETQKEIAEKAIPVLN